MSLSFFCSDSVLQRLLTGSALLFGLVGFCEAAHLSSTVSPTGLVPEPRDRNEVAVVDAMVRDHEVLAKAAEEAGMEVVEVSGNGVGAMAAALEGRHGLDAVHVLSHGTAGRIVLGDAVVSTATLGEHAEALATLADSLAADGDLLLYGCLVG